jgi:hypothetical protein
MAGSPEHPGDHLIEVVVGEIVGALGYRLILAEQVARLRGVGRDRNVLYRVALATAARSMIRSTPTVCTSLHGKELACGGQQPLARGTSVRRSHEISCPVLARVAAYSAGAVSTASATASRIATVVSAAPLLIKAPGMTADTPNPT